MGNSFEKVVRWFGVVGLVLIAVAMAAILFAITDKAVSNEAARDSFITAFGGAAFAYLFVKYGELFTRLSNREKTNVDTIVNLEYLFNEHLNFIGINITVADQMIQALEERKPVHFLKFKPVPVAPSDLRNLKNTDFVNDVFNYFADIDKINDDLNMLQRFTERLMNDVSKRPIVQQSMAEAYIFQQVFQANSETLISQLRDIKGFLEKADNNLTTLIGKAQYVKKHRAWWLSLAVPWFGITNYNKKTLEKELPSYIDQLKKDQAENIKNSSEQIKDVKTKNNKSSKA